jgi:hypothetical protein
MQEIFCDGVSHFQKDLFDSLEIGSQRDGNFKLLFPRTNRVELLCQREVIPIIYGYYYSSICFCESPLLRNFPTGSASQYK